MGGGQVRTAIVGHGVFMMWISQQAKFGVECKGGGRTAKHGYGMTSKNSGRTMTAIIAIVGMMPPRQSVSMRLSDQMSSHDKTMMPSKGSKVPCFFVMVAMGLTTWVSSCQYLLWCQYYTSKSAFFGVAVRVLESLCPLVIRRSTSGCRLPR